MTKDNTFQFLVGKKIQDFKRKKLKKDDLHVSLISTRVLVPRLASTTPLTRVAPRSCVSHRASLALAEDSLALHFLFMELWVVKEGFTCQCFDKT